MKTIPFQQDLRPEVRTVFGNVDYLKFEKELRRIDALINSSGIERVFVERSVAKYKAEALADGIAVRKGHLANHEKHSIRALRCLVLQSLLGESYREMSRRLAECPLFRWFCQLETLGPIRVPAKSTLQSYAQWLPEAEMREVVGALLQATQDKQELLELANGIELSHVWLDSTAIKTNMHFPVDWVLLRDAVRTLMKATHLIRKHGLKSRMNEPREFLKEMNRLSIEMTQCRRKENAKKLRKKTLRKMKKLVNTVESHAKRHRDLLDREWGKTDWTRKQAEQVLRRIDAIIELLPQAKKQAHERIIGERIVKGHEKILSLYEREAQVIVRGKIDAEVEFGNSLLLGEQGDGLIVDWRLHRESAPSDSRLLTSSIARTEQLTGKKIKVITADRGFDSQDNTRMLAEAKIVNAICPRNPRELAARSKEKKFIQLQKRRGATEGRIAIFKNKFLGRPLKMKGFVHRELAVAWRVLSHNLWVLARLPRAEKLDCAA